MSSKSNTTPIRRKIPLTAYVVLGFFIGLVFPFVASFVELIVFGTPISVSNLLVEWNEIPVMIRFGAPVVLSGVFFLLMSNIRRRQLQEIKYSNSLLAHSEELEAKNERLTELNEALDGLVYTASHDLKTPIVNLQSLITMLRSVREQSISEAMEQNILERMDRSVDRFQETISGLLDVSRINRADANEQEPSNIQQVLDRVTEDLEGMLHKSQGEITTEIPSGTHVMLSPVLLGSVLQNLLTNALKYHQPGIPPLITVKAQSLGQQVRLEIIDNGIGMNLKDDPEKLFRMFTRLTKASEGNGIGLYIVKRTVEMVKGKIEVESEPNQGATFRVFLPRASSPSPGSREAIA